MTWRILLIVAIVAIFTWAIIPTKANPEPIRRGLDLKGGTHLVMEVNTGEAVRAEVDQSIEALKAQVTKNALPQPLMKRTSDTTFTVTPPSGVSAAEYEKLGHDWLGSFNIAAADTGLTFTMKDNASAELRDQTVAHAIETIRNRIDALGVTEPIIAREGGLRGDRIVIQLPVVDDPARVKEIIKTTAQLQFRIVEGSGVDPNNISLPAGVNKQDVDILQGVKTDEFGRASGVEYYAVRRSVPVTGQDLKSARVQKGNLGSPVIGFTMTPDGGRKFGALTASNIKRQLAIVLDNKVQSAPVINSQIEDSGVIEGSFTAQSAADLALILRSGSLPASLTTLEERTVGPSLGRDSIRQGMLASLIGFALVVLMMVGFYRGAGLNAILALMLNVLILLGMMSYFHATLTLPGIAGIVLTLGMAVDSNVLVFERIREELRDGKPVRGAIEAGFSRAFGTVVDTHMTTIIAALFLFQFGTGPVKGFAVTLLIGLAASLYTAFFVSRVIFDLVYKPTDRPKTISI